jgi:hypothetical protein
VHAFRCRLQRSNPLTERSEVAEPGHTEALNAPDVINKLSLTSGLQSRDTPTGEDYAVFVVIAITAGADRDAASHHRTTTTAHHSKANAHGRLVILVSPHFGGTFGCGARVFPIGLTQRHQDLFLRKADLHPACSNLFLDSRGRRIKSRLMVFDSRIGRRASCADDQQNA